MRGNVRRWLGGAVGLTAAFSAAAPVASGDGEVSASPERLVKREYESVAFERSGEPDRLFNGARLRLSFSGADDEMQIGWSAECNHFVTEVVVGPSALEVDDSLTYTLIGCLARRHERQDERLAAFFTSDPEWRSSKPRRLTLKSGESVIEFRRRPAAKR